MGDPASQPTVLVVDDDPDVVEILAEALRGDGYSVLRARDGIEAIERVGAVPATRVDVLITDIAMPRASGLDLMREISPENRPLTIIVMSAFADQQARAQAKALGATAVFHKPFYIDELLLLVQRLVPSRPRDRQRTAT